MQMQLIDDGRVAGETKMACGYNIRMSTVPSYHPTIQLFQAILQWGACNEQPPAGDERTNKRRELTFLMQCALLVII
jgi:hypothetical protein